MDVVPHEDPQSFRVEKVPTICVVEGRKLRRRIVAPRGCRDLERELEPLAALAEMG
jgi:hypothetical protein